LRPTQQRGRGIFELITSIAGVNIVKPEQHVGDDVAKAGGGNRLTADAGYSIT
jgi:hypothetical protein